LGKLFREAIDEEEEGRGGDGKLRGGGGNI